MTLNNEHEHLLSVNCQPGTRCNPAQYLTSSCLEGAIDLATESDGLCEAVPMRPA